MPDPTPPTPSRLDDAVKRADWHRHRGDEFRRMSEVHCREYWLNRASIAYALAQIIILGMRDEGHG